MMSEVSGTVSGLASQGKLSHKLKNKIFLKNMLAESHFRAPVGLLHISLFQNLRLEIILLIWDMLFSEQREKSRQHGNKVAGKQEKQLCGHNGYPICSHAVGQRM